MQVIQPYTLHKKVVETSNSEEQDQSIHVDNKNAKASSLLESNISTESRNINYVNLPQRQTFEVISLNGIPLGDGSTASNSVTLPTITQSPVTTAQASSTDVSYVSYPENDKNDLLSAISEDQLYVENAGSFGQRLRVSSSDSLQGDASYSQTTTAATQFDRVSVPRENEGMYNFVRNRYSNKPYSGLIKKNRKIQGVHLYNLGFSGHVDLPEELAPVSNEFSSTSLRPIMTTIDQYLSTSPLQDLSRAIGTSQQTFYSTTEDSRQVESKIGLSNPQQINYALPSKREDQAKSLGLSELGNGNATSEIDRNDGTNRVTSIPKTTEGFFKPIVVGEVSSHKPFEYSTTFECEDDIVTSTPSTTYSTTVRPITSSQVEFSSNVQNKGYEAISSLVLNSIQAGVALFNAGDTHLINGDQNTNPAPVKEDVHENAEFSTSENQQTKTQQSQVVYEKVNHRFRDESEKVAEETRDIVTPSTNQGIEIQKSVEMYHNAPVQEIHYPPQLVSQVIHIDQLRGGQRYIAENVQNAKQYQRSDDSATNTPYQINHDVTNIYQSIPEDKSLLSHRLYVINQEYGTDDENATQTNSILQSGAQRYFHIYPVIKENRDFKSSLESNDERTYLDSGAVNTIRVGVESQQVNEPSVSFESYRSHDNGASYSTDINHGQQQITVAVPHSVDASQNIAQVQSDSKPRETSFETKPNYQLEQEKNTNHEETIGIQLPLEFEIAQQGSETEASADVQPDQAEKFVEKIVHVPQPYPVEIEKIIETKVPVPVEKIIEKKIPIPHPYPIPIHIPVERIIEKRIPIPQPIPIPVEKIVEKKIPVPVQKIIPQPIPVPFKVAQPYTIEKVIEKPVHIPVPVEKIIEKKVPVSQPYPIEIERIIERKIPIPVEVTKYVEKPVPIPVPYGLQYGVTYQQVMKPQNHNLYSTQTASSVPLYGLSVIKNKPIYNLTQPFQGYVYPKPFISFLEGQSNGINPYYNGKQDLNFAKKQFLSHFTFASQPSVMHSYSTYNQGHRRRHTLHRPGTKEKAEKDRYIGPVPMQHTRPPVPVSTLRKVKQDPYEKIGKGNFRQSKMEYGFKPPMVPSVQYDEETASKVET